MDYLQLSKTATNCWPERPVSQGLPSHTVQNEWPSLFSVNVVRPLPDSVRPSLVVGRCRCPLLRDIDNIRRPQLTFLAEQCSRFQRICFSKPSLASPWPKWTPPARRAQRLLLAQEKPKERLRRLFPWRRPLVSREPSLPDTLPPSFIPFI